MAVLDVQEDLYYVHIEHWLQMGGEVKIIRLEQENTISSYFLEEEQTNESDLELDFDFGMTEGPG